MKKFYLFLFGSLALAFTAKAQSSFSDDFESYTVGQTIALASPVWGTWSGNVAGEDAPISSEQAHSGTKSLKLYTTSTTGGPSDIILPFGGAHDAGDFNLDMWMYVVNGRAGYFNFQSETTTGTKWAADFFFENTGKMYVNTDGNSIPKITGVSYPMGEWFNLKVQVSLSNNQWTVLINNSLAGQFNNTANKIASMDIYAYGSASELAWLYVDDVSYSYTPLVPKATDASMYYLSSRSVGLTGDNIPLSFTMRNLGTNVITSFDATVDNGTSTNTYNITGQSIASLATKTISVPTPYTLIGGNQSLTVTLSNVNGGVDDDPTNNSSTGTLRGYTPAPGKKSLVEESTGTWCQWCPRGAVFMNLMNSRYPNHFVGVAVHNNDVMTVPSYDAGNTGFPGFTGFPSVVLNRDTLMDPSGIELPFLESVTVPTPATIINGATYDAATGELQISVTTTFTQATAGDYTLSAAVIENNVKGTTTAYNQANAYAGGTNGVMGGFEALANPVPYTKMTYNEVARGLLSDYYGVPGSIPTSIPANGTYTANFTYTVTSANKYANMEIVGILLGPDGKAVNATKTTIDEAIANGLVTATHDLVTDNKVDIAPNPATTSTNINLTLAKPAETSVRVFNTLGQEVANRSYGMLSGAQTLPFITSNLVNGVYTVQITAGDQMISRKLVKE
jgi:hypothetical protein